MPLRQPRAYRCRRYADMPRRTRNIVMMPQRYARRRSHFSYAAA